MTRKHYIKGGQPFNATHCHGANIKSWLSTYPLQTNSFWRQYPLTKSHHLICKHNLKKVRSASTSVQSEKNLRKKLKFSCKCHCKRMAKAYSENLRPRPGRLMVSNQFSLIGPRMPLSLESHTTVIHWESADWLSY